MNLVPKSFYVACQDGLVLLPGHEFEFDGRVLVVHKLRQPYCNWDKNYKVSESSMGFDIAIAPTRVRTVAVTYAIDVMKKISDSQWQKYLAAAAQVRKNLKIIKGNP